MKDSKTLLLCPICHETDRRLRCKSTNYFPYSDILHIIYVKCLNKAVKTPKRATDRLTVTDLQHIRPNVILNEIRKIGTRTI